MNRNRKISKKLVPVAVAVVVAGMEDQSDSKCFCNNRYCI